MLLCITKTVVLALMNMPMIKVSVFGVGVFKLVVCVGVCACVCVCVRVCMLLCRKAR